MGQAAQGLGRHGATARWHGRMAVEMSSSFKLVTGDKFVGNSWGDEGEGEGGEAARRKQTRQHNSTILLCTSHQP